MPPYQFIERPSPFAPMSGDSLPVWAISRADLERGQFDKTALAWAKSAGFTAAKGRCCWPHRGMASLQAPCSDLVMKPIATLSSAASLPALPGRLAHRDIADPRRCYGAGLRHGVLSL
jgi:hypothetical protein